MLVFSERTKVSHRVKTCITNQSSISSFILNPVNLREHTASCSSSHHLRVFSSSRPVPSHFSPVFFCPRSSFRPHLFLLIPPFPVTFLCCRLILSCRQGCLLSAESSGPWLRFKTFLCGCSV